MQELKNNLFFVGIKHSGKTTFASRIASRLLVESSDSDDLILNTLGGESVRDYYKREGILWAFFVEECRNAMLKYYFKHIFFVSLQIDYLAVLM